MFESLNYRGLRETVLLTDCMMVRGSHSPLVASLRCPKPAVSVVTSVDGYTTKLCILVVIMLFVWVCFCVCVDEKCPPRGRSCPRELCSPRRRDANNIRLTARGTLDQPAKIVKFDLTRCAPPHYSFKRAAACF